VILEYAHGCCLIGPSDNYQNEELLNYLDVLFDDADSDLRKDLNKNSCNIYFFRELHSIKNCIRSYWILFFEEKENILHFNEKYILDTYQN